jgi:hypothetical protein
MSLRKQPDRQAKKKNKMEDPEPENFDMVENLLINYGMTGANLAHDIFSYLDFSSLQGGRLVCKSWNLFLTNDKKLWMNKLWRTQPCLEFLSNHLSEDGDENSSGTKESNM